MNLMGVDPIAFFNAWRERRMNSVQEFFAQLPVVTRIRVATAVVCSVIGDMIVGASVGDSGVWRIDGGAIDDLTVLAAS